MTPSRASTADSFSATPVSGANCGANSTTVDARMTTTSSAIRQCFLTGSSIYRLTPSNLYQRSRLTFIR